jgi:hypothetical protein
VTVDSIVNTWPPQLQPWMTVDLFDYTNAIANMWAQCDVYLEDPDNDIVAWQALFDVDLAPFNGLPWLAQCVGERIPVGFNDAQARDWIKTSPKWSRGTPQGIVDAVKRVLTGAQVVQFAERMKLDGTYDDDTIAVMTYASQTPDPNLVRNALRQNVPADIVWQYQETAHATWALVEAGMSSWTQLESTYGPTWANVSGSTPGFNVWA